MSDGSSTIPETTESTTPTVDTPKEIKTNTPDERRNSTPMPDKKPTETTEAGPSALAFLTKKPLSELSLRDIFLWRNILVSLTVLFITMAFVTLIKSKGYTFVTLIGRIVQLQVLAFLGYALYLHYIKKEAPGSIGIFNCQLTEEALKPYSAAFVVNFNDCIKKFGELVSWVEPLTTLKYLAAVQFVCFLGNRISGLTIFTYVLIYLFSVPVVYEWKKTEIDVVLEKISKIVNEQVGKIVEKIPPNIKEKLAFLTPKVKSE
jgi:hypothetical protein